MASLPVESSPEPRATRWLAVPLVVGALVALTVGVLAKEHFASSRNYGYFRLFFSDPLHLKAWFATGVAVLAVTQLVTAAWIFRKLPWSRPAWVPALHRWTGRLTFALTIPVAYHCVFQLGFQRFDDRVLAHSLAGCALYGAFAAKITVVRLHRFPAWVLPAAGGLLFAAIIAVWWSSALWLFKSDGVRF
jgi:hypothetical protein